MGMVDGINIKRDKLIYEGIPGMGVKTSPYLKHINSLSKIRGRRPASLMELPTNKKIKPRTVHDQQTTRNTTAKIVLTLELTP